MRFLENYSLLEHHTFGMDVRTAAFVEYASESELKDFLQNHPLKGKLWLHIGSGSNLLFTGDYPGIILHSGIKGVDVLEENVTEVYLRVGAGEVWDDLVARTVERKWYGAENLSLIPGEVGASAVQNIGAYGVEVKDLIVQVETLNVETGEKRIFDKDECRYAYRDSIFKQELKGKYIVTAVVYRLSKLPVYKLEYGNVKSELAKWNYELSLENVRKVIIAVREAKLPDPKIQGNAGSFFMNPIVSRRQFDRLQETYPEIPYYEVGVDRIKIPAAWLIDRCGWKGKRMGRAGVHDKQALVLVNCGGATGQEIIALSEEIKKSVFERFGVSIYPEVNFV